MEPSMWQEYKDQDFMVLGISKESTSNLLSFIQDQGITFPVLHDDLNIYAEYNLPGGQSPYPRDFIVDQQGIIRWASTEYDPANMILITESLLFPSMPIQRTVAAELFSANWCETCSLTDIVIDSLTNEFGPDSLVVLEYHYEDELAIVEGEDRARWYVPGPLGIPNMWFDGTINVVGANSQTYETYRKHILERLNQPSPLEIQLEAHAVSNATRFRIPAPGVYNSLSEPIENSGGEVLARIKVVAPISDSALKVQFVLFENDVEGQYDYVVRDILPPEDFNITSFGDSVTVLRSFQIDTPWIPEQMGVAVFVQSDSSKSILQAAQKFLASSVFSRGDANDDGQITIADVVYLINYLFKSGPPPVPQLWRGDVNCDNEVQITDAVYMINYFFKGGPPPCD